jgi:hypothetical protein
MNAPIKPDQAKYSGCEGVAGTIQFGMMTAKAVTTSRTEMSSLPAIKSLRDALIVIRSNNYFAKKSRITLATRLTCSSVNSA